MSKATDQQWRVQVRAGRNKPWKNKGLWETREDARLAAKTERRYGINGKYIGYGFGNTRVVRYVKGEK